MKKIAAFTPADKNHEAEFQTLLKTLRKFHSEKELPLIRVDNQNPADTDFWYRAKPVIASELLNEYETVIGMDSDQLIVGPLNEIWEGDFDVAVVRNNPNYPIGVWDITHPYYYNNGLVVMKSKAFVEKWKALCLSRHFPIYQYREQDILNLLCSDYYDFKVRVLDGLKIYGEVAKPFWPQFSMQDNKIMLNGSQLCVIHFGGGAGSPDKGNYRIRFRPEVVDYIDKLVK